MGIGMGDSMYAAEQFQKLMPAMTDSCFQLKLYYRTGVWPFGAQVLTRVGRSLDPHSPMKTMVRPSRRDFFSAGQRLVRHCSFAASSRWMARPIPCAAPVTSATFPANGPDMMGVPLCCRALVARSCVVQGW